MKLTQKQILQLAAEAMTDPRTVKKIYEGKRVQNLGRERVLAAAKKLRFPLPDVEVS